VTNGKPAYEEGRVKMKSLREIQRQEYLVGQ